MQSILYLEQVPRILEQMFTFYVYVLIENITFNECTINYMLKYTFISCVN